jgi:hypothetical protein
MFPRTAAQLAGARRWIDAQLAKIPRREPRTSPAVASIDRKATSIFVAVGLAFWLTMSGVSLVLGKRWKPLPAMSNLAQTLGLRQRWSLYVGKNTTHQYVFPALLSDGRRVDLRRKAGPIDWDHRQPKAKNGHWTKYESGTSKPARAARYADYLARRWDREHPKNPIAELEIILKQRAPGEEFKYKLLWQRDFDPIAEPNGPGVESGQPARNRKQVRLDLDARTLDGRRAKVRGARKSAGSEDGDAIDPVRLVPFTTVDGSQILANADALDEVSGRRRIVVRCKLADAKTIRGARVKFFADSPWLETHGKWRTGTLADCARSSAGHGR